MCVIVNVMTKSQPKPVDLSVFKDTVDEALVAFGTDVSYAVEMIQKAKTILNKQKMGAARAKKKDT